MGKVPDEIKKLQGFFLSIATEKVEEMKKALQQKNLSLIRTHAHQLKGSGASFGFPEISKIAEQIENECLTDSQDKVEKLINEMDELLRIINSKNPPNAGIDLPSDN